MNPLTPQSGLFSAHQLSAKTQLQVDRTLSVLGAAALVLGVAGLAGWALNVPVLRHLHPSLPAIRPLSALSLTLMAGALRFATSRPRIGQGLAWATLVVACLPVFPSLAGAEVFLREILTGAAVAQDRMDRTLPTPLPTALGYALLATTFLISRKPRFILASQTIAAVMFFGGLVPLLASVYRMPTGSSPLLPTEPSLQACLGVVLLSLGILLQVPQRGIIGLLSSDTSGSRAARLLLLPAIAIPIVLGGLFVYARQAGTLHLDAVVPAFVTAVAATLASAILWVARQNARTELESRHSEEAMRHSLDDSPLMMWMSNSTGDLSHINPALLEFLGMDRSEGLGTGWQSCIHPDDVSLVTKQRSASGASRRSFSIEFRVRAADGEWHWVLSTGVPRATTSRRLAGFTGSWIDVTARKAAENALQNFADELEQRVEARTADLRASRDELVRQTGLLESVVQNMSEGVRAVANDGKLILANNMARQLFGATSTGDTPPHNQEGHGFFRPDGKTPFPLEELPLYLAMQGESVDDVSIVARHENAPDGILLRITSRPMRDPDGNPLGALLVARDVTELEKATEATRQLAAVVASSGDAILSVTPGGLISTWNKGAEEMYGYTAEEAVGLSLGQLEPALAASDLDALLTSLTHGTAVVRRETTAERRDGTSLDIAATLSPIRDEDGQVTAISVVHHDVTQLKEVERRIQNLNDQLEQRVRDRTAELTAASQDLENYASSVAHDLRTPLRGIAGFARVLEEDYAEAVGQEGQRVIGVIRKNAQDMAAFIDALLAFSAVERQPPRKVAVEVGAMVRECVDSLGQETADREVVFHVGSLPACLADPALLKQVFLSLLTNAVKFTRPREVAHIEIGSRTEASGETAYFVRDNGVGFDMSNTRRLFGAFQRLHSPAEFEGTGLGLAGVARIIAAHGGRIWADSEPDQGATFAFVIE